MAAEPGLTEPPRAFLAVRRNRDVTDRRAPQKHRYAAPSNTNQGGTHMRTRTTTVAVAAIALLTLTACGSNVNDKSRGYNADNLNQSETQFMDVVYDVSTDQDKMRDSTAGEIAKGAEAFRLFCLANEDERAQKMDDEGKLDQADQDKLNQAFTDHLCTGEEDDTASNDDATKDTQEPASSAHNKDVKITGQGSKTEYGTTTYRVAFTVTNSGDEAANYWVEFEAYDKDGDFLGGTGSSVERLGPGKTKTDEVDLYDETIENGKLSDIETVKIKTVDYCDGSDDDPVMCQI